MAQNKKMPTGQAQGVAIRCVAKVGGQNPKLDDVLGDVGISDDLAVKALTREIVHGKGGVTKEGYKMKTSDFNSISPESTVDDVADVIHNNAQPRNKQPA
jgi:hypothetical protein